MDYDYFDQIKSSILIWGNFSDHKNEFRIRSSEPYVTASSASYEQNGQRVRDIEFKMKYGLSFRIFKFDLFLGNATGFMPVAFNVNSFDNKPKNYGHWMMTPETNMLRLEAFTEGPCALDLNRSVKANLIFTMGNFQQINPDEGLPFYINIKGLAIRPVQ